MGTYDQPGTFTKISIKKLQSPDINPVDILYNYITQAPSARSFIFLYYFFDKKSALFEKGKNGSYKLVNPYPGVVNKILKGALELEKSGVSMTAPQDRTTYIRLALYFNALSDEAYHALFPASYTGRQYRPTRCSVKKMEYCLNAIGEESLNPMILQEAVWMLGLELRYTPSTCDEIIQQFTMEDSPTAQRGATTMLFREIEGIVQKLKNEPDEQKKRACVMSLLKSRAKAFKGYSQTRQRVWNDLVQKYTGKEDLSINELYRLLNFRFLFFGKTDKRKIIDLDRQVKDVLLPPQYDRFWNIAGTDRLSNTVFWTFLSNLSNDAVQTAKEQLKKRSESGEITQKNERNHINTAKIIAGCVSTMDEEFDSTKVEKALAGENLTLEPKVKTLRQLAQRYASLDQPTRNMILTLSYAVALQDSQGADAETVRSRFEDRANHFLGMAGYGHLNIKLPLDAALYSCIQDDRILPLDALYERVITQKVTGAGGLREVSFDLPAPAEIKRILWEKAENRTSKSKQTTAAAPEIDTPAGVPDDTAAPVDTDIDPDTPKPIISQEAKRNREDDKKFTEQLQHQKYIDFMPRTDDGHIDPNGLCPGERSVPVDARFVKIEVYPFYYNASDTKRVKLNDSPEARSFLEKRVEDRCQIVQLSAKLDEDEKKLLYAATDLIDLENVQIATPGKGSDTQKQPPDNPLTTHLEEEIPMEYLGTNVPSGKKVACYMKLTYYAEKNCDPIASQTLQMDFHEEYRRYAQKCFGVIAGPGHNVFDRLKKKYDFPYDFLNVTICDALQKAAKNYDPERAQFDTYFWKYVLGEISKFAYDEWKEHISLDASLDGAEDEDDRTRAMANKIQREISTDSPENALLNYTSELRNSLEDLYPHPQELYAQMKKALMTPIEQHVLTLFIGIAPYDYIYPDEAKLRAAYLHFLGSEEAADKAVEWEKFLDKQLEGEALDFAAIDRVPTQKVQEYFELDKQAAAEKKRRANHIYKFLHRPLTPSDIYTVFKTVFKNIEALSNFEVTKSDIQNFAFFGYRKLLDAQ